MTGRDSDGIYQEIFHAVNDAILIHDVETGAIVDANRAAVDLYGYPREELTQLDIDDLSPDESAFTKERALSLIRAAVDEGEQRFEWRIERADGDRRWVEINLRRAVIRGEKRLLAVTRDVSDRKTREETVAALHEAMRSMVEVSEAREVAETAVETAADVLDMPISGIWFVDDEGDALVPVAVSAGGDDLISNPPTYTADGDSLSWQAYETGTVRRYDNVHEATGVYNPETPIRSELVLPLGSHGVMNIGSTDPNAFDESDVTLGRLLAANTEAMLDRVSREQTLRDRTDQLEQQTSQMEFFNSILRHDVLNGLTVIQGNAELLEEELSGAERQSAETIVSWCRNVTDVVNRVRQILDTITGQTSVDPKTVDLSAMLEAEIGRLRSTYAGVTVETDVPEGVTVLAEDLLGDVFRNVLTNAVEHNDPDGLELSISITATEERATVRIADNGTGIPDDRKADIFRRGETGHAKRTGSGFGLFFVDVMVSEYGGDVWVEDNDAGGATFVVELRRPT